MTPTEFLDALDAASVGATPGPLRIAEGEIAWDVIDGEDCEIAQHMTEGWARHIAAHSPAVTAALRACARALVDLQAERLTVAATESYGMERAREALAALAAAGGGDA